LFPILSTLQEDRWLTSFSKENWSHLTQTNCEVKRVSEARKQWLIFNNLEENIFKLKLKVPYQWAKFSVFNFFETTTSTSQDEFSQQKSLPRTAVVPFSKLIDILFIQLTYSQPRALAVNHKWLLRWLVLAKQAHYWHRKFVISRKPKVERLLVLSTSTNCKSSKLVWHPSSFYQRLYFAIESMLFYSVTCLNMTVLRPLEIVNLPSKHAVQTTFFACFSSVFRPSGTIFWCSFFNWNIVTLMGWLTYSKSMLYCNCYGWWGNVLLESCRLYTCHNWHWSFFGHWTALAFVFLSFA